MDHKISTYVLVGFFLLATSVFFVIAGISPITPSLNLDGQDQFSITGYNMSGNNINWSDLHEFPVACPSGSYITQIDDSVTCSAIGGELGAINSSVINNIFYVQVRNASDIQVTIDQASSGDKVFIPNGIYNLEDTILINKSLTLEGAAQPSFRVSPSSSGTVINASASLNGLNMINVTASGVTIKTLGLSGSSITNNGIALLDGTGGFLGENLYLELQGASGLFAIKTMDAGNSLIHIGTRENGLHGMNIQRSDFRILDYYSHRHWNGAALMLSPSSGTQVSNMHSFYNNYGIYLNGTDTSSFTNVMLEQNNYSGFYLDSTSSNINRITIADSIFYLNDCPAVGCSSGDGDGTPVIYLNADTHDIKGVTFSGNTFDSSTPIFNYSESSGGEIKDVIFANNIYTADIGSYPAGVNLLTIDDNSIKSVSTQGLVLGMSFNNDSISGNISLDSSEFGYDGTVYGAEFNSEGKIGGCYDFDGDGDYINPFSSVGEGYSELSACAWAKPTADGQWGIVGNEGDTFRLQFMTAGRYNFRVYNTTGGCEIKTSSGAGYDPNEWYHLCLVYDNETLKGYVNGEIQNNDYDITCNAGALGDGFSNIAIGAAGIAGVNNFNGSIDDVRIYNRAISADEVLRMYEQEEEIDTAYLNRKGGKIYGDIDPVSDLLVTLGSGVLRYLKGYFYDLDVSGLLNNIGNASINNYYGGMYYHNHTATALSFDVDGQYYHLFMTDAPSVNGFTSNNLGMALNSSLTANVAGKYQVHYMATGSGENNEVYYTSVFINEVNQDNCENHHKITAGGDILTQSGNCFIDLAVGENVSVRTANIGATGAGNYYSGNLNLVRIGN